MPNCKKHEHCDVVCTCADGYYCHDPTHEAQWRHIPYPGQDMPDDPEDYYNDRAEERWGTGAYDREAGRSRP